MRRYSVYSPNHTIATVAITSKISKKMTTPPVYDGAPAWVGSAPSAADGRPVDEGEVPMSEDASVAAAIAEVMRRNVVEVFTTTDDDARRGLVEEIYQPDAGFHDAEGSVSGHDAIDAKIRSLQLDAPGVVFTVTAEPDVVRDLGRVSWALGPADGPAVVSGMDVARVRDGRIAELYTFLDPR